MRPSLRFGVAYDFRNPPGSSLSNPELYAQVLDQVVLAEQLGFDTVWFSEHHFTDDGYLPSWIPVAGAVLARTTRIRVSTAVALLPFYNPLRLAEDLAVLDNLSGGRVELGIGLGYAPHEFKGFGLPVPNRVSLTEEGLEILRLAWSGQPFSFHGRRHHIDDVRVSPAPVQPGGPPVWLSAMTRGGAERAARYGTHFLPQGVRADTLDLWRALAPEPATRRVGIIRSWLVSDDIERDWPAVRDAERYRMEAYARFFAESNEPFRLGGTGAISQRWIKGSAAEVAAELGDYIESHGFTDVITWGCPPGLRPEQMNASLESFARDAMPQLRARFG